MKMVDRVAELISSSMSATDAGDSVAVNTQCLFPSNGVVTVHVYGGRETSMVSDQGATARVVESHGVIVPNINRWLSGFAIRAGLRVANNEIRSPQVAVSALPAAVMLVANAAATASRYAIENYAMRESPDLVEEIQDRLIHRFGRSQVQSDVELTGKSNRVYHFDFRVADHGGNYAVIDHVNPHSASINAKAAAHIDLTRREDKRIIQTLVYDSSLDWNSSDIIFLQSAAPTVPLEKMNDAIERRISY